MESRNTYHQAKLINSLLITELKRNFEKTMIAASLTLVILAGAIVEIANIATPREKVEDDLVATEQKQKLTSRD